MRHAFLICAHGSYKLLSELLCRLDDPDFDCYVHIDSKAGKVDYAYFESLAEHSRVVFLRNRLNVKWGGVSQIKVTLCLLEAALKGGCYDYFHFISGVDYPIKSNSYIKSFFEEHQGTEFIGFTPWTKVLDDKIGRYHLFPGQLVNNNSFINWLNVLSFAIQKRLGIYHYKDTHRFSKGCNWWDITKDLAEALVGSKKEFLKHYRMTLCADEIFVQTFVADNARFRERLYDVNDEYRGCLRLIDWERGNPYVWKHTDISEILASPALFARKFSENDMDIITLLNKNLK